MTDTAANAPSSPSEDRDDPAQVQDASEQEDAPETFSREYVTTLREEAKQARIKAQRADWWATEARRLALREGTRGILAAPEALPWDDDWATDDGIDHDAIRAAAEALAEAKPWLARPRGDVGQGRHSTGHDSPSLSALLRG